MTKPQIRLGVLNYIFIISLLILEIVSTILAYLAYYFTKTRMGVLRHVVYLNGKWEDSINLPFLKWIFIAILLIFILIVIFSFIKIRANKDMRYIRDNVFINVLTLITLLVNIGVAYYLIFYNTAVHRAYYISSFCLLLAALFQQLIYYFISFKLIKN